MRVVSYGVAACLFAGCATSGRRPSAVEGNGRASGVSVQFCAASTTPVEGYRELADAQDQVFYVAPECVVTERDIVDAKVTEDGRGQPAVLVSLSATGADRLAAFTRAHIGKPMAILVDDQLVTAPMIHSEFSAAAMISGEFTQARAERIAMALSRKPKDP